MTKGEKKDERPRVKEKYKALVETAADAIFTLDLLGRFTFANPAVERVSGYSEEELLGKHFRDLLPAKYIPGCLNVFQKASRGQPTLPIEIEMITKQSERVSLELLGRPVKRGRKIVEIIGIARDITERKRTEEQLRVKDSAIASSINAIALADLEGNLTYVNDSFLKLWGYDDNEVLGRPAVEFWQREEKASEVVEALRDRGSWIGELVAKRKDGSLFDVQLSASMVTDVAGKPIRMMSSFVDITERKLTEEALRESEEKFRSLAEQSPNMIFINKKGKVVYANEKSEEVMGYTREEFHSPDFDFLNLIAPEYRGIVKSAFAKHKRGEEVEPYEYTLITKDGERIEAIIATRLIDYEGESAILGIVTDITERKRMEEALRENEENFTAVAENANDGILVAVGEGVHIYVNKRAAEITGYSVAELLETDMKGLVHPDEFEKVMERYRKRLAGKPVPTRYETIFIRKDGKSVPVEFTAAKTIWQGEPASVVFFRDITERKRAEEELRDHTEQLEALRQVGLELSAQLDLDALLGSIVSRAVELLKGSAGGLYLYRPKRDVLEWAVSIGSNIAPIGSVLRRGEGLSGKVWETGVPVIVDDYQHWEGQATIYEGYPFAAVVGVPVRWGEEFLGVVNVLADAPRTFSPADAELLSLLATQAAIAIENARLYEETKNRLARLSALQETSGAVASTLELDKLLNLIIQQATTLLQGDGGIINLVNWEKKEDEVVAGTGSAAATLGYRSPLEGSLSGWVTLHNQPVISNQLQDDSRADRRPRSWLVEGMKEQTQSVAIAPLTVKDQVIGTLVVMDKQGGKGEFHQADLDLLVAFANQAATAIENARLYEQEQEQRQEAETLRQAAQALSATLDLQEVFESILSELQRMVPYDSASVQLLKGDRLEIIGGYGFPNLDELLGISFPVEGDNPNRQVVTTRAPFIVEDAPAVYSNFREEPHAQAGIRAWLGVPLLFGDRLVGMIALDKKMPGFYTEEHARLALAFAAQAAIAVENARLYQEAQKRLAETTVLHRVAEVINSTLELKEVCQRVVEELSEAFGYRLVDIYLLEEDGLRLQANVGYDEKTTIELIPLERGVVGRVGRTGQAAFIPDVSQDPDYISAYPDITSEICVPVHSGQTLVGTLNVECDDKRPLTDDDLKLLSTLSSHIGVAIENARLYEEEQRLSTQRKTIAEVGRTAAAILDMDTLLSRVVHLIAQGFGYYRVHIFQVDHDSGYAVYKAGTGEAGVSIAEEGLRLQIGKEGMIGWVAQHGKSLLANDVSLDPHYVPHPALPDTRSELSVPIRVGEKIIGVLDVQSTELNAFDESDRNTLQTLADQLAVAMENARLYQETRRLAITDSLTGLHNLRYFYEALEKEIQRSKRYHRSVSLIILDIDKFKAYNDLYGHLAGDDLLIELAQLMSEVTRQTDTLARYGGEEFAIILPETETEGARVLAERLLEEVREHRFSTEDGQTIGRITISLGVATYPHHADSAKALVGATDEALLRAKRAGKNRVFAFGEKLIELKSR